MMDQLASLVAVLAAAGAAVLQCRRTVRRSEPVLLRLESRERRPGRH